MKKISEIIGDYSVSGTRRMQSPGNLRAGRPTLGSRSTIQSDLEKDMSSFRQELNVLPKSVVLYVTNGGKVLAVSRGSNLQDKNMPGGHVEAGEEPAAAAARELQEETGIRAKKFFPIYSRVSGGYLVTAYRVTDYTGKLRSSPEGVASWEDPSVVLAGRYSDYFQDMIASLYNA